MVAPASIIRPDAVSPSWLTEVLRAKGIDADVRALTVERVGTGQLGDTRRFRIEYAGAPAPDAPRSLVGKFDAPDPVSAATGHTLGIYRSEVMFYRELAGAAALRTPDVYLAEIDDESHFVLLLEDLAAARAGDQLSRCTLDEVRQVLAEAARLHAAFWGDEHLTEQPWLYTPDGAQGFYSTEMIEQAWAHVERTYDGWLAPEITEVCRRYVAGHARWNRPRPGPRCLAHSDFRPDNMLFTGPGVRVAVVDWQTVTFLPVGLDVPYFLGGALDPEQRRSVEPDLLRGYHDDLQRHGVTGYGFEQLMLDHRHYTFAALAVAISATVLVRRTERGDRMLMRMITDAARHVLDVNGLELLG